MLVIFRGLPGTGKSTLVQRLLERRTDFLVLSRDVMRRAIFPSPTYSSQEKSMVDELIASMAGFLLDRGKSVVINGMSLSSAAAVDRLVEVAVSRGLAARIIECVCRQETSLARIKGDGGSHPAGDRGEYLYFEVKARFQPVRHTVLTVDTEGDPATAILEILRYLE